MSNINLTSDSSSGFLESDFDQIKGVLQDRTYNSFIINQVISLTAGEAITSGDVCYLSSDGKMYKAIASGESTSSGFLGMAMEDISSGSGGTFLVNGIYTTSGLTAGDKLYLSDSTNGGVTNTAPSASGSIVRIIGYSLSSTELYFKPDNSYVENS